VRLDYAALYGRIHKKQKWFPGYSICDHTQDVKALIDRFGVVSLLDYGSGRGLQYSERGIHVEWGVEQPYCFDVGVREFRHKPVGERFDGVICCDVMEHIAKCDVDEVLVDVMSFADRFVFFVIGCHLSRDGKRLKNGQNVHLTVKPKEWWEAKISEFTPEGVTVRVKYDERIRRRKDVA